MLVVRGIIRRKSFRKTLKSHDPTHLGGRASLSA